MGMMQPITCQRDNFKWMRPVYLGENDLNPPTHSLAAFAMVRNQEVSPGWQELLTELFWLNLC